MELTLTCLLIVVHSKCCNLARLNLASFNYFNGRGRGLNDWKRYRANRGRFKDPSCSQIYISDRRRYRSNRGRFRPSSEDRRRSYRSNRDRFKKSINYKTLVMGPVSPMKTETGQRTFVPVCFISFE